MHRTKKLRRGLALIGLLSQVLEDIQTIIYFSILLHCIVQWVLQVMLPSACSFIVLVFTAFLYMFRPTWPEQTNNKEKGSRQTHTQETTKLTKENNTRKTQMEMCRVLPHEKWQKKPAKQNPLDI
jgi:hypothetical protein